MIHDPTTTTQQVVRPASERSSEKTSGPGNDYPFGETSPAGAADLLLRYSVVKSASSSPLRDDLELCLAELDVLIALVGSASQTVLTYLHFEMEERRIMVIEALQSGFEL